MKRFLLSLPPNRVRRQYRGGAQLDALEGVENPWDGDRPEDWIASTVTARNPGQAPVPGEGLARVFLPGGREAFLRDLFEQHPEHYLGRRHFESLGAELGFLAKLLDSAMRLHVQAHPTADFARRHLGSRWGKLETYVILGVRPGHDPYLRLGFQHPPSTREEFRRIVLEQDSAALDACFDPVPVAVGEVWVVPGGLAHAIGEGLLVLEVMEPTDLVVRCEFEREDIVVPPPARFMGRDPDFALSIFDLTPLPVEEVRGRCLVRPRTLREEDGFREELLIGPEQTECFTTRRRVVARPAGVPGAGCVEVGVVVEGAGTARAHGEEIGLRRGARFLVAAAAEEVAFLPKPGHPLTILACRPGGAAGAP